MSYSNSSNTANLNSNPPAFTNIFRQSNVTKSKPIPTNYTNVSSNSRQVEANNFYLNPKLDDDLYSETNYDPPSTKNKYKYSSTNHRRQDSYDQNDKANSSPLSKTPDSTTDIGNWIDVPDSGIGGGGSSGIGGGGSVGTIGDSDPEMVESNNQSINHDDELENDWVEEELDSAQSVLVQSNEMSSAHSNYQRHRYVEDYTTKRLKTFVATTLHNEQAYLDKISKLLSFRTFLQENFNGSQTDINVLFTDIFSIYKSHEVVCLKLQNFLDSFSDLTQPHVNNNSSNLLIKETFLSSALQLLANIMMASFPVYLEFVENYSRSMSLLSKLEKAGISSGLLSLSKRKSFLDCQSDFNNKLIASGISGGSIKKSDKKSLFGFNKASNKVQGTGGEFNLYYNEKSENERLDVGRYFTEEILHRPTKLHLFIYSLKEECLRAAQELPINTTNSLRSNIKSMFDNIESKEMRDKIFEQIKLNIMPKEARKHEDVVELSESNNERKLRHLILYGDCLVCCRLKKDKRHLKWFIPIDKLELFLDDYKSAKSENELRNLRSDLVSLREQINKEQNASTRNQQKIKKKLVEHELELTLQSSRLKLIIRSNPSLNYNTSNTLTTTSNATTQLLTQQTRTNLFNTHMLSLGSSMTNVSLSANHNHNNGISSFLANSTQNLASITASHTNNSTYSSTAANNCQYVFLFTSDFERNAWVEEMNSVIFAYKSRKTPITIQQSDIESRINAIKKLEEPPKAIISSSCTGSLELNVKHIDSLPQANNVYVAVELKSLGSYLQVAQTKSSGSTTNPVWNEKFTLELQCVDSLRIILYGETNGKSLAISSQELKIDSNINLNKINCAKLNNGIIIQISMKFLSPKKTITRRRTRNRNDIFGGSLAELLQRENTTIPRILKDCVEVIETKGIDEVGIYRVSSVVSEVQKMKDLYSKNPNLALSELRQKSPHLSANVLKLYLRELPDPLFTSQLYHRFMAALDITVPDFRSVELCRIFNDLPESNKTIIIFILTHLLNISLRSDKNMMGLQNLCTLFGPTLMKLSPKEQQIDDMAKEIKESMQQAQALFYILKLHEDNRLLVDPEQKEQLNQFALLQNKKRLEITEDRTGQESSHTDVINSGMSAVKLYERMSLKDERSPRANMQTAL